MRSLESKRGLPKWVYRREDRRRKKGQCRWERQRKGKKKRRGKKKEDARSVLRTPALLNEVVPRCLRSSLERLPEVLIIGVDFALT